jgi:tetratricopeptide (TPR) repeat protein
MVLNRRVQIIYLISVLSILSACSSLQDKKGPAPVPAKKSINTETKQEPKPLNVFKPSVTQTIRTEDTSPPIRKSEANLLSSLLTKADKAIQARQWLRAQRVLEQAIRVDADNPAIFEKYGELYQLMGAEDKARSMYERAEYYR